jgi:hypothetical protein
MWWVWLTLDHWAFKVSIAKLDGRDEYKIRFTPKWVCRAYNLEETEDFFTTLLNVSNYLKKKDGPVFMEFYKRVRIYFNQCIKHTILLFERNYFSRGKEIIIENKRDYDFSELLP